MNKLLIPKSAHIEPKQFYYIGSNIVSSINDFDKFEITSETPFSEQTFGAVDATLLYKGDYTFKIMCYDAKLQRISVFGDNRFSDPNSWMKKNRLYVLIEFRNILNYDEHIDIYYNLEIDEIRITGSRKKSSKSKNIIIKHKNFIDDFFTAKYVYHIIKIANPFTSLNFNSIFNDKICFFKLICDRVYNKIGNKYFKNSVDFSKLKKHIEGYSRDGVPYDVHLYYKFALKKPIAFQCECKTSELICRYVIFWLHDMYNRNTYHDKKVTFYLQFDCRDNGKTYYEYLNFLSEVNIDENVATNYIYLDTSKRYQYEMPEDSDNAVKEIYPIMEEILKAIKSTLNFNCSMLDVQKDLESKISDLSAF